MDSTSHSKSEAWLRYADDLGLAPFNLNRTPRSSDDSLSAPSVANAMTSSTGAASNAAAPIAAAPISRPAPSPSQTVGIPAASSSAFSPSASDVRSLGGRSFSSGITQRPLSGASAPEASARVSPSTPAPSLFESTDRIENDSLDRIRTDIGPACTRCKLHKARTNIVFGVGNPKAQLVFVGEGPGRDEDEQGEPFVGRAGKLLTQMIEAMGLRRSDVYICNVVKCRPPENRLPEKDEIEICSPYLLRQLDTIRPKVVCCLGACSAQTLLNTNQGISRFRGEFFDYRGAKLIATYHPAYLLRNPAAKGDVWKDLQKIMALLNLQPPKKKGSSS